MPPAGTSAMGSRRRRERAAREPSGSHDLEARECDRRGACARTVYSEDSRCELNLSRRDLANALVEGIARRPASERSLPLLLGMRSTAPRRIPHVWVRRCCVRLLDSRVAFGDLESQSSAPAADAASTHWPSAQVRPSNPQPGKFCLHVGVANAPLFPVLLVAVQMFRLSEAGGLPSSVVKHKIGTRTTIAAGEPEECSPP
jgi:hypothetical protein